MKRILLSVVAVVMLVATSLLVIGSAATASRHRHKSDPIVALSGGQTATVNCSGSSLTWAQTDGTDGVLTCAATPTTTTVPPTTTTTVPPPTTTTTVPPTTTTTVAGSFWHPTLYQDFQWEIGTTFDITNPSLNGEGVTAYNGDTAPGDNPKVYDIDAIENSAQEVAAIHAAGAKAICYIEVGTAGNYYTAAQEGIATTYYAQLSAAGDLGNSLSGYPEKFININSASSVSIIEAMIQQQCANKGFDGVETDLDETYGSNEGSTGFTITLANEESYLTTLSNYMHANGLAWIAKDLSDTGDQSFVNFGAAHAQGLIDEQASQYGTIGLDSVFITAGEPVWDAEYSVALANFCPSDNASGINGVLFTTALNGSRQPCR